MRKFYFLLTAIVCGLVSNAQLSGPKTIPGDYATITAAVTALNTSGVGPGGVTFNVNAGHTETAPAGGIVMGSATLNASSVANPIVFQKSGAGANPLITAFTGTSTTLDGIFKIAGTDNVSIISINLQEAAGNATATTRMEWGYAILKLSLSDGSQNINITNCTVTLNKANTTSIGIYGGNHIATATTALVVASAAGTNANIRLNGNTLSNVYTGISINGYTTNSSFYDTGLEIGVTAGNDVSNYGGGSSTTYGIHANAQNSPQILNNTVTLGTGTTTTSYGIYMGSAGTGNLNINFNTVSVSSSATTSQLTAITNLGSFAGGTVNINNNIVQNITYTTATSGNSYIIYEQGGTGTVNINNNTVTGLNHASATTTGSGSIYMIYKTTTSTTVTASNNIIHSNTFNGTTGGTFAGIYLSSGTTQIANNNQIYNNTIPATGTGTSGTLYGIRLVGTTVTANSNTIYGNFINKTTGTGAVYGIYDLSSPSNETFNSNQIYSIGTGGSGTVGGLYTNTATGTRTASLNTIYSLSSNGGTVYGMYQLSSSPNVFQNKIYDLSSTGSAGSVIGIYMGSGTTANVYNNLVGDLRAPTSTSHTAVTGIQVAGGTTMNIYYNTVYVNASSSAGTTFGTSAFYVSSTAPTVTSINNIFVNTSTPGTTGGVTAAFRFVSAPTNYSSSSNNNLYYAGTPSTTNLLYVEGSTTTTNGQQTITELKTYLSPRDQASVTENPPFASTVGSSPLFLHIAAGTPTQVESGGFPVAGITTDYDMDVRNANFPDIGADEGSFTASPDGTGPSITYTPAANACIPGDRVITVNISDVSGVPVSGSLMPRIYYSKNGGAYVSAAGVLTSGTGIVGTWDFTISAAALGGLINGDVISYYIIAQDASVSNNISSNPGGVIASDVNTVTTPPPTPNNYLIGVTSGVYTVGVGGNFTTLTAAVANYNAGCITGNITFSLIDATYPSEVFPITINAVAGSGPSATLTIKPAAGVNTTISGSSTTGLIKLNGADYVIIDGSNNGTNSRNLTISNSSATGANGIIVSSLGTGLGATNNSLKNLIISATSTTATAYGISVGGATAGSTGADNDNNTIENNLISGVSVGVYAIGQSAGVNDNLIVTGNTININTTSTTTFGIRLGEGTGGTISLNTISLETTGATAPTGIAIEAGFVSASVTRNNITKALTTNTNGYGGRGISVGTGTATSALTISNNMISGINGSNETSFGNSSAMGIAIGVSGTTITTTTGGVNLYFNSVNLDGTFSRATNNILTAALYVGSGASTLDIRNNIFVNKLVNTSSATGTKAYAVYSAAANTAFTDINYNDYFAGGANAVLGYLTSDRLTLANWQTATTKDANSINIEPLFNSVSDLHLQNIDQNVPLNGTGTTVSVTNDYDNDTRNSPPDIGADEFVLTSCAGAAGGDLSAPTTSYCVSGNPSLTLSGFSTGVGSTYQLQSSTDNINFVNVAGQTNPGNIVVGTVTSTTYYRFSVTCTSGSPQAYSDTVTITINPLPVVAISGPSSAVCVGTSSILTASGADTYVWSPSTGLSATTGSSVTANPTSSTTYTVTGTITATGCTNTANYTLMMYPVIDITASATPGTICNGGSSQLNASATTGSPIKITEVTAFRTGTGATNPYPAYATGADMLEISNLSTQAVDVSGLTVELYAGTTLNRSGAIPAGTIIPANQVMIVHLATGTDDPANRYFNLSSGGSDFVQSGTGYGFVIKSGATVVDAVATNSYVWPAVSGVSAADWSGNVPSSSTLAGIIRTGASDNNTATDWSVSSAALLQTIGTYNTGYANIPPPVFTYSWSPAASLSDATIANPVATPTATQTYILTVTETSSGCTNTANVIVTVNQPPAITTEPTAQSACLGSPATFSVTATGASLTYQWRKAGVDIAGATSSSYTIPAVALSDAANYDVVVTGICAPLTDTSVTVSLTVTTAPAITAEPVATQTVCANTAASMTVTATGSGLTYQWRKGGVAISGATSATYTIPSTVTGDAGNYDVVITGTCGTATSAVSVLNVDAATVINTEPVAQNVCPGTAASFTVAATGTGTLTYQWRLNGADISGANAATYNIASAAAGNVGSYDVIVNSSCGADTSAAVSLTLKAVTAITTQPANQATCPGGNVTFTVAATGDGTLTYQWRKDGVNIAGANASSYTINGVTAADAASYDVIVTGGCGSLTSSAATLSLNSATITSAPSAQTVCAGSPASFTVAASGVGTLTYQWRKNGTNIAGATSTTYAIASTVAADAGNYDVVITGSCGSITSTPVSLTVNPATTITVNPSAQGACLGGNATFTVTAAGTGTLTYQWRKGTVNIPGATSSSYTITGVTASSAANYDVIVTGGCGTATSNPVPLTINPATAITTQPAAQTRCVGGSATFTVAATGSGTLTYQWRKGGTNIAGATSSSYTITGLVAGDAANYDVIVTGICGSVTSTAVALTINPATVITTQPLAQTICALNQASFTVAATGTGTLTYQWRKNGVNIAGATNTTYTIASAATGDAGNYDVVITSSCGTLNSASVALVVNACTALPVVDEDITSAVLMPNIVNQNSLLRVVARRAMKVDWTVTDAKGRVVMQFSQSVNSGQNDIRVQAGSLASGTYFLSGTTRNGKIKTIRFVRL
jgi:hypothetical protein